MQRGTEERSVGKIGCDGTLPATLREDTLPQGDLTLLLPLHTSLRTMDPVLALVVGGGSVVEGELF